MTPEQPHFCLCALTDQQWWTVQGPESKSPAMFLPPVRTRPDFTLLVLPPNWSIGEALYFLSLDSPPLQTSMFGRLQVSLLSRRPFPRGAAEHRRGPRAWEGVCRGLGDEAAECITTAGSPAPTGQTAGALRACPVQPFYWPTHAKHW